VSTRRNANVVIVEGTCGSGKTTLLRAAELLFEEREVTVLWQRVTYAPIAVHEDHDTLDDEINRRVLLDILCRVRDEVVEPRRLVLIDTLHATHLVRAGALTVESFVEIDRALNELGALVVALRISEETIRTRAIVGRRGTGFAEYARKFGATEDDMLIYFAHEQERLFDVLATHSSLPQVVLDGDGARESLHAQFRSAVQQHLVA
jgi:thymidylate kinase